MRAALYAPYFKVAMMQGNPRGASLQEFDLAEASLLKGQALLMPSYNCKSDDRNLMMRLVEVRNTLAELTYRRRLRDEGIKINMDLLPIAHRLYLASDCSVNCRAQEADIESSLTYQLMSIDPLAALKHAMNGISLSRELLKQYPGDKTLEQSLGSLMAVAAGAYRALGDLTHAADAYRESIEIREGLLRDDPHNSFIKRNLMIVYGNYATVLGIPWSANLNKPAEARVYAGKCVELARQIVEADANDVTARHDLGMSLSRLGMIDPGTENMAQSLASLEEAESLIRPIVRANPKSVDTANQVALILEYKGHRLQALGRHEEAMAAYRGSMAIIQSFFDLQNSAVVGQYLTDEESIALLEVSSGDADGAVRQANKALDEARKVSDPSPRTDSKVLMLAKAWRRLALRNRTQD